VDLGFVIRTPKDGRLYVTPLCLPAAFALSDLWRNLLGFGVEFATETLPERLADIERFTNTGSSAWAARVFQEFVWEVFLARGLTRDSADLAVTFTCYPLEIDGPVERHTFRFQQYYVSTLEYPNSQAARYNLGKEVARMAQWCMQHNIDMLFRCPAACDQVHFFAIKPNGHYIAIQTSVSELNSHSTAEQLRKIPDLFGLCRDKFDLYLYVTTHELKSHPRLVKDDAGSLRLYRMASAAEWIVL
jgi:hypothetical protein